MADNDKKQNRSGDASKQEKESNSSCSCDHSSWGCDHHHNCDDKRATEMNNLQDQLLKSNEMIALLNQKIFTLKSQIDEMNQTYKQKIEAKMQEATVLFNQQIREKQARLDAEFKEKQKYAIEDKLLQLIEIINQFTIACNYKLTDEKLISYQKGFKMFLTLFSKLLQDWGVIIIDPKVGQEFDSHEMECFATKEVNDMKDNCIVSVVHQGYKLHKHILKPALVIVCKHNK